MEFKAVFGIEEDEFYDLLHCAVVADVCLKDMGRKAPTKGKLARSGEDLGYFIGLAVLKEKDFLGNYWNEVFPAFVTVRGLKVKESFYSLSFAFDNFVMKLDFDANNFRKDIKDFLDVCKKEAGRIDGRKGESYLLYGLYCLKHLGAEIDMFDKSLPERFLSWDRFRQVVY